MTESDKATSVENFEKAIYPIWKGVEDKTWKEEQAMSMEEVACQRVLLECLTLHKQDLAIHNSGIKPVRHSEKQIGDQALMSELRRRAVRAGG